jgi:RAB6A-GEF complex partner protein 1
MYWPCGVPRVYAYNGPHHPSTTGEGEADDGTSEERLTRRHNSISGDQEKCDDRSWEKESSAGVVGLFVAAADHIFTTITSSSLAIWQNRPTAVLAVAIRSTSSLERYGTNQAVLLRGDCAIAVVQTSRGYLLTYSIEIDPHARVYQQQFDSSQARRRSSLPSFGSDDATGLREAILRLKRAIKVDAGVNAVLALPSELVIATARPPAVQCIKWSPDAGGPHMSAELLSKMEWVHKKTVIVKMVHNRAMHLSLWITQDGKAYAVQRQNPLARKRESSAESSESENPSFESPKLFNGHCFHDPVSEDLVAIAIAVNAKFSLLAVGCRNGDLLVYGVRDYAGNITLSHKIAAVASPASAGRLTCLTYSPDGYCLFVGFEKGWATWSVFGKQGVSSFTASSAQSETSQEGWLSGISAASWSAGGSELLLTSPGDHRIWKLEFSRSAAAGCFSCANLVRALFQTPTELIMYRGHDMPDLTSISGDASLWHHAQFPAAYVHNHGPIKCAVVSQDGRYAAIAGRRGLAHYSVKSGRWKTFTNSVEESAFTVRGGMCWFNHVLIAATESDGSYELRAYSRDANLGQSSMLYLENLPATVVFLGPSGEDSLLVYTSENILYHFVISLTSQGMNLVQVGQIAFHGVVRAPTRVRSVSWILPESQLRNGDPSQDVALASVLFLVDDKLVLLQPSRTDDGGLRYDMRVVAQHIEFYILMRDQLFFNFATMGDESIPPTPSSGHGLNGIPHHHTLRDSLWTFSGSDLRMWSDVRDVLRMALEGSLTDNASFLSVPVDFYPLSILLNKGVVLGIESELVQRRDLPFAQFRTPIRTHLFIPYLLQHHLSAELDPSSALALAHQYQHLSYFAHALEVLLHNVLDEEADSGTKNSAKHQSLLPPVLSLLYSSLSESSYLSTIVQCIRKTEITSWPVLLAHLPPPAMLFEQALRLDDLKTATGCLIVLQSFGEDHGEGTDREEDVENYVTRLMTLAREKFDWELCSELAQFLMALDPMGDALKRVVEAVGFHQLESWKVHTPAKATGLGLRIPEQEETVKDVAPDSNDAQLSASERHPLEPNSPASIDYFSASPGREPWSLGPDSRNAH